MRITKDKLLRLAKKATASDLLTCMVLWAHSKAGIVSGVDQDTLSASVGLSTRTLQRSLDNLRRKGLVLRVGAHNPGPKAMDLLDLSRPNLDWVELAKGMGVPASRPTTAEEFNDAFARSLTEPGPYLIEVVI